MESVKNNDANEKQDTPTDFQSIVKKRENTENNFVKTKRNVKAASPKLKNTTKARVREKNESNVKNVLSAYGKAKRKRQNLHKNEGQKKSNTGSPFLIQNSLKQIRRPSSRTQNLKDKIKLVCLIVMATENSQTECFERSIKNAITALEDASHKLKELKTPNKTPVKDSIERRQHEAMVIIE